MVNNATKVHSRRHWRFVPRSDSFPRSVCAVSVEMVQQLYAIFYVTWRKMRQEKSCRGIEQVQEAGRKQPFLS